MAAAMETVLSFLFVSNLVILGAFGGVKTVDNAALRLFQQTLFRGQQPLAASAEGFRVGLSPQALNNGAVRAIRSAGSMQEGPSELPPLSVNSWSTNIVTSATEPGDFDDDDTEADAELLYTAMNIQHFRASANGSLSECALLYMTDILGTTAKTWLYQAQSSGWVAVRAQMPEWTDKGTAVLPYTKRIWPASVVVRRQDSPTDLLFILGGATFVFGLFNDVWRLDRQEWLRVATTGGSEQLSRFRHSATSAISPAEADEAATVFVFGGQRIRSDPSVLEPFVFLNDVWMLRIAQNYSSGVWSQLHAGGPASENLPTPRAHGELAATGDGKLIMFGGWTLNFNESSIVPESVLLRDLWEFNPMTKSWTALRRLNEVCKQGASQGGSLGPSVTPPGTYLKDLDILVAYSMNCEDEPLESHKALIHVYSRAQRSWTAIQPVAPYDLVPYTSLHSASAGDYSFLILRRGMQMRTESHFAPFQLRFTPCAGTGETTGLNNSMLMKLDSPPAFLPAYDTLKCMQIISAQEGVLFAVGGLRSTTSVKQAATFARLKTIGVWILEHSERTWSFVAPDPAPLERAGFSVVTYNSTLTLFGGYFLTIPVHTSEPSAVEFFGDLWCFNERTMAWTEGTFISEDGHLVDSIELAYHTAVFLEEQQQMLIIGGYNVRGIQSEVLLWTPVLDQDACRGQLTRLVPQRGQQHLPCLVGHTATVIRDKVIVYGGATEVDKLDQLRPICFMLDIPSLRWSNLSNSAPDGRIFHAAVAYGTKLIVTGGCHGAWLNKRLTPKIDFATTCRHAESLETILVLDTITMVWMKIQANNLLAPGNVFMHAMTAFDNYIHIFGGQFLGDSQSGSKMTGGSYLIRLRPGCPAGYFAGNFSDGPCDTCDIYSFSESPGSTQCKACPGKAMTNQLAAASQAACSYCKPNTCHGHGACSVEPTSGVASCECNFGYTPSDNCLLPVYYLVLGLAILIQLFIIAALIGIRKLYEHKQKEKDKARLLRITRKEVSDLASAWEISYDEITLRHRIDDNSPGGFGEVWLAEYRDMQVAVKKLQRHHYYSTFRQEFEREVDMMRTLRHPNIVLFLGAGSEPSTQLPFLVLEYMQNGALAEILRNPQVNIDHAQRIRFALDVAKGMRFLHSLTPPRIHRDLKSANLLVSERWVVKVADFGHARTVPDLGMTELNTLTASGQHMRVSWRSSGIPDNFEQSFSMEEKEPLLDHKAKMMTIDVGTLVWSSPELLSRGPYGASTDVYSYGIVLWELHSRAEPFAEYPELRFCSDFCSAVVEGRRPTILSDCNEAYRKLIEDCWQENTDARPTFADIVPRLDQQLEDWAHGRMVTVA